MVPKKLIYLLKYNYDNLWWPIIIFFKISTSPLTWTYGSRLFRVRQLPRGKVGKGIKCVQLNMRKKDASNSNGQWRVNWEKEYESNCKSKEERRWKLMTETNATQFKKDAARKINISIKREVQESTSFIYLYESLPAPLALKTFQSRINSSIKRSLFNPKAFWCL